MSTTHIEKVVQQFEEKFFNPDINSSSLPIHPDYSNGGVGRMMEELRDFLRTALEEQREQMNTEMHDAMDRNAVHVREALIKEILAMGGPNWGEFIDKKDLEKMLFSLQSHK